jgi:hypothetical protein
MAIFAIMKEFTGYSSLDTGRSEAEIPRTREYWILDAGYSILVTGMFNIRYWIFITDCHPVGIFAVVGRIWSLFVI